MGEKKTSLPSLPLLLLLPLLALSCSKKDAANPPALTVNGKVITASEVDDAAAFLRQQQSILSPGLLFEGGGDIIRQLAARQLTANMLLIAEIKRRGWRADSAHIEREAARVIAQFPDRETFLSQLAEMGESEESMRNGIEEEFLMDSLISAIGATAEPANDEECRAHYEKNAGRYAEPEMAKVSHIVFELKPDAADSSVKTAMVSAQAASKRAKAGANFDSLVKEYSPKLGGDLGWFKRGDIPELDRKVFSMKKGEISDPVPSSMGIHILKKTDEKAPRQMNYTETETGIRAELTERKKAERVNAYVDSLIGAADVKYADTTLIMTAKNL